jgi:hypothetical protein
MRVSLEPVIVFLDHRGSLFEPLDPEQPLALGDPAVISQLPGSVS